MKRRRSLLGRCGYLLLSLTFLLVFGAANTYALPMELGTGHIELKASGPNGDYPYLGDYDGKVTDSTFGYTTDFEEVFCVSSDHMANPEFVTFYAIDGTNAKLSKAAFIADYWKSNYSTTDDAIKVQAQGAIWATMGVIVEGLLGTDGLDLELYHLAKDKSTYSTNNWYFADSQYKQDYLTPVPEPATLLLLGTGMLGIAIVGRKKHFKK